MANGETPQQIYHREVEEALEADGTRLGEVFIAWREDPNQHSIADKVGTSTAVVYYHTRTIRALTESGKVTYTPGVAKKVADEIRRFVKRNRDIDILSRETITKLGDLEDEYNRISNNEEGIIRENERIERETEKLQKSDSPGIYVYSYPHYVNYPVVSSDEDDTTSRTYLKIGMSETDAAGRIGQQNTTAVPEPIMPLRIYTHPDGNLKEIERSIHRHLDAADHNQVNKGRRRGRPRESGDEWFLTHLPFIDSTAGLLGLKIEYALRRGR